MSFSKLSAAIAAAAVGICGWTAAANAQAIASPGCNAINGGTFNQDADVTGGLAIILAFDFDGGETITVTITDATDSLAFVDVNDLFDGDVGSLTRAVTLGGPGTFTVGSAIAGAGATIRFSCAAGGGAGGNEEAAEVQNEEATVRNVNSTIQIPTQPGALPSTLGLAETAPRRKLEDEVEAHRLFLIERLGPARDALVVLLRDDLLKLRLNDTAGDQTKTFDFFQAILTKLEEAGGDPVEILQAFDAIVDILSFTSTEVIPAELQRRVVGLSTNQTSEIESELKLPDPPSLNRNSTSFTELARRSILKVLDDYQARVKKLEDLPKPSANSLGDGEQILFSSGGPGQVEFAIDSDMLLDLGQLASLGENGVSVSTQPRDYKIWARGRITVLDGNRNGVDGEAGEVMFGVINRFDDNIEIGAFGGFFASDVTTNTLGMDVETKSLRIGLYGNMLIGSGLKAGVSGTFENGEVDTERAGVTADYGFTAYDLSASLSGAIAAEQWIVVPTASATISHRSDDAHTDSGGLFIGSEQQTDGTLTGSVSVSRTFVVESGGLQTVTPNFIVTGNAFLTDRGEQDTEHFALTLGAGSSFGFGNGAFLTATGSIGGFGQDTIGYTGQLRFTLPF